MELTLARFHKAHERDFDIALKEIRSGQKQTHWMWYIFPQLQGLGYSPESWYYGIQNRQEAIDFLADPLLSAHLYEITEELLKLDGPIFHILPSPDHLKLLSCMTLFSEVSGNPLFQEVIDKFFQGITDIQTLSRLSAQP